MERADNFRTTIIIFITLTWASLLLRCWVRLKMIKSFGWDDAFMVLAQLLFTVLAAIGYRNTYHGIGTHLSESNPHWISNALKLLFLDELFYSLNVTAIKISITLFLFRILARPVHKKILYVAMAIGCTYTTGFFLSILFQCRPISKYWNHKEPGTCVDPAVTVGFAYGYSAINISTDFTLAIIPIFIVRELVMNQRTKVAVSIILAMGTMASIATVIRIPYIRLLAASKDFLYEMYGIVLWSFLEPAIGIIAANLATFRPLLQAATQMKSTRSGSRKASGAPSSGNPSKQSADASKERAPFGSLASSKDSRDHESAGSKEILDGTYLDLEMNANDMEPVQHEKKRISTAECGPVDPRW